MRTSLATGSIRFSELSSLSLTPRILVTGDAATRIAEVAKSGFDFIIMPTHAGTFRRMLLGSTTAKVLHDADCPVLTSKHAETNCSAPVGAPRMVVCHRLRRGLRKSAPLCPSGSPGSGR